mmetsp:Transcript_12200/g.10818  ORF Transcript_12200/g.10818 Transcript_12200/m.10818 type:complete len:98 (+) Transcript_12200:854-1147(+)
MKPCDIEKAQKLFGEKSCNEISSNYSFINSNKNLLSLMAKVSTRNVVYYNDPKRGVPTDVSAIDLNHSHESCELNEVLHSLNKGLKVLSAQPEKNKI